MSIEGTSGQQLRSALSISLCSDRLLVIFSIMMVIATEMLIYSGHLQAGIILHILTLILLTLSAIWVTESHVSRSLQVLLMLPLLRLLTLSMPVFSEVTLSHFAFVYLPMLLPAYLVIKYQGLSLSGDRMFSKRIPGYILLSIVVGAIIAWGEFLIIRPENLIPSISFINLSKLFLVMIFIVGFVEELIFRFLLQSRMEISFGKLGGLLIVSLTFGFMHTGYGTIYEILYASCAGLVLGFMFQKTRSLAFVSLTHGFVNIFLFGIIPIIHIFRF